MVAVEDFEMKIAGIVVRTLMGLLFIWGSVAFFFHMYPKPELTGNLKIFNEGMDASGYLMVLVKSVELVCGIAFLSGRFVTLASVVIAPIIVNILCVHIFLDHTGLPVAIFLVLANGFLAYLNRENYKSLFVVK